MPATAMLAGNLLLALVWVVLTSRFDVEGFALGFAVGYAVLAVPQRITGRSTYHAKSRRLVGFAVYYVIELVRANIRVAVDVVAPRPDLHPGIVAVPLDARTDVEITLLAGLVTMTPGSLALDVSDDRTVLYVHSMYTRDPAALRRSIKDDYERRILELTR